MRGIQSNTIIFMRSGQPGRSFLSRRAHLLTTCQAGGGIPPVGQAVRSSRSAFQPLLQRGQAMPQADIACAAGFMFCTISTAMWAAYRHPHSAACLRIATPIFFLRKRNKNENERR